MAYGHTPAISRLLEKADAMGFKTKLLDDRKLEDLPTDFLPGMLIEIRLGPGQIPKVKAKQPGGSVRQAGAPAGQKAGKREQEADDSMPQNPRREDSKVKSNLGGETSKTDD